MLEERKVKWRHWMLDPSLTTWHQRSHFICVEPHLTKFMARGFSLEKKTNTAWHFHGFSNWISAFSYGLVTGHNNKTQGYHRVHGQFEILSITAWQRNPKQECNIIDHIPLSQFVNPWANLQNGTQTFCVKFKANQEDKLNLQLLPK